MESYKEEKDVTSYVEEEGSMMKTRAACFGSIMMSVAGGLLLGWWEYEYHPSFSQLWMVPFGLVLFATPVIVWFSLVVSHFCNSNDGVDDGTTSVSQPVYPLGNSVSPKKDEQWNHHHVDRV